MESMNDQQKERALQVLKAYLAADDGKFVKEEAKLDAERVIVIEGELKPLLHDYLSGKCELDEFKSKIDSINKRHEYWGFKGIKGMMFFNVLRNTAAYSGANTRENIEQDFTDLDKALKEAIAVPADESMARKKIKSFADYVKKIGDQWVDSGNDRRGVPRALSVPFFLSYFWQIQERNVWPIFYTQSVQIMTDLNLWQPTGVLTEDYIAYKKIKEELSKLFTEKAKRPFGLYDVEHVFWYEGNRDSTAEIPEGNIRVAKIPINPETKIYKLDIQLPDSFIPPIISIIPAMARNENSLAKAAERSGIKLDFAFEKYINSAFTILGYETKQLGQGKGRVPDGLALAIDDNYAIIWDAKVRSDEYSMGRDDRAIREYIATQSRDLKRRQNLKNIYYFIISSSFADDYDDSIGLIKMEMGINEVILLEAEALVAMVDIRLRAPLQVTLGPDGLQRLFTKSGTLTADDVRNLLL